MLVVCVWRNKKFSTMPTKKKKKVAKKTAPKRKAVKKVAKRKVAKKKKR